MSHTQSTIYPLTPKTKYHESSYVKPLTLSLSNDTYNCNKKIDINIKVTCHEDEVKYMEDILLLRLL